LKKTLVPLFLALAVMLMSPNIAGAVTTATHITDLREPWVTNDSWGKVLHAYARIADYSSDSEGTTTFRTCIQASTSGTAGSWTSDSTMCVEAFYDASQYNSWVQQVNRKVCGGGSLHPLWHYRTRVTFNNQHYFSNQVAVRYRVC
jgi:hypothetical protein